ncbi:myosin-IIIb isoform X2 [Xenopus tropicalis]|uniref:non-specific serine/threonine protein kinase n=1 Tax=Xenopus tropicalis TaxID=8364 RepID=A0A803KC37_XENTR|nr:myosin-IIIb isoform X2 [Xenopus tropicalis]
MTGGVGVAVRAWAGLDAGAQSDSVEQPKLTGGALRGRAMGETPAGGLDWAALWDRIPGEDAALLAELTENKLLATLRDRYRDHRIYTYVGDILIAVNPFRDLPLYSPEISDIFSSRPLSSLPPHIFAVADRAYNSLQGNPGKLSRNQCVVISGDSGAGKTESTKLLLKHLVRRSRGNLQLGQQILQVNPLLEAFGNAQTVMNPNSSRFGKYIQLRFRDGAVRGAKINEYLLEKSRVSHQDPGEKNFHIFYYMLGGIPDEEKQVYGLLQPSLYRYIGSKWEEATPSHWVESYQRVCNAMRMVGFQEQEELDLKVILSGVLSLGNVVFEPQESGGVGVCPTAMGWLKAAAGQFGVQEEELLSCLTCTLSLTRGESIRRLHSQQQAEDSRDSIARGVYSRLFGWIVCKINELLAGDMDMGKELQEIGILDIFGFENFSVNRFEQLCINLANEQLQNFFNHHIFLMEEQHYKEEGMEREAVPFSNNQATLELFLARPWGILSLLDEQSSFPQATDVSFVEKLNSTYRESPLYERGRGFEPGFAIHHYAGKIKYSAAGFLEKNRDALPTNINRLFISSETSLISILFTASISRTGTLTPQQRAKVKVSQEKGSSRKISVGAQFRHSLAVLMEKMYLAEPHFIRCIKPNSQNEPGLLETQTVLNQLRYNGLMETLRIRRDGFSWRPSVQEFVARFGILLLTPGAEVSRESCKRIAETAQLIGWHCGKSRLFFKYWHQDQLQRRLVELRDAAIVIQKRYKGMLCHRRYRVMLKEMKEQQLRLLQEQREREEAAERERLRLQEEEKLRSLAAPVPAPRKRPLLPRPCRAPQLPVPRPRSQLIELSPFDNPKAPAGGTPLSAVKGGEREILRLQRRKTLQWFKETQVSKVLDDGTVPLWLHGMISRRDAENLLQDKELGDFLIRISQTRAGYILTYRGASRCRHYMICVQSNECYVIVGEDRAHSSLSALVQFHQQVGIQPYGEILRHPCPQLSNWTPDCEELKFLTRTLSLGDENDSSKGEINPPNSVHEPPHSDKLNRHRNCKTEAPTRSLPRFHQSIRLAMREIQQVSPYPPMSES